MPFLLERGDWQASSWRLLPTTPSPLTALSVNVVASWASCVQHLPFEVQDDWQYVNPSSVYYLSAQQGP